MANLSNNDIAQAIYQLTKSKTGTELEKLNREIVKFLARRRLLSKSKDILEKLNKISNKENGVIEAKILSAKGVDEKIKKELKEFLKKRYEAKDVVFKEKVNEKLIGGVRLEIEDEVIDLTVKNKIKRLQEHLTKKI